MHDSRVDLRAVKSTHQSARSVSESSSKNSEGKHGDKGFIFDLVMIAAAFMAGVTVHHYFGSGDPKIAKQDLQDRDTIYSSNEGQKIVGKPATSVSTSLFA